MYPQLNIFDTPEATARAVAELILSKAKEKIKQSLPLNIALSGGNTPKLLFQILAKEYVDQMPWHILRLFWVDERCVPPTHAESNFGMTYENLLKHVPIQETNIFRMTGEAESQTEAKNYADLLNTQLPILNGLPKFDLVLLGMGDDGHTASIFPNNLSLLDAKETVAVAVHPVSGQKRITLTGNVINAAENIVFLVTGISKSTVLRQIINEEPGFEKYPTSHIQPVKGKVTFYLDKAAATEIHQ
ncbi:MAG: 6-phosphogluconolactonase [Paludibacter sp.]